MNVTLEVNGRAQTWETAPGELLIDTLRLHGYYGVKRGCETGDCGACTVLLDGRAVNACVTFTGTAAGRRVLTIEGLASPERLHPIQEAFLDGGAVQCGFCTPGMILLAKVLLDGNPHPTEGEVRKALGGILCRCTGYRKPVEAILAAAQRMRPAKGASAGRKGG
ncbi:MAG: (2Fe-2S)-binding protein [Candidatus Tectomicrobia bacterium]|nr:(2Fe-2S)-binding protein [Candidatus Tectomicrobia bacterium]